MKKWKRKYKELKEQYLETQDKLEHKIETITEIEKILVELVIDVQIVFDKLQEKFTDPAVSEFRKGFGSFKDSTTDWKNAFTYIDKTGNDFDIDKKGLWAQIPEPFVSTFPNGFNNPMFKAFLYKDVDINKHKAVSCIPAPNALYFNEDKTPNQEVDNIPISSNGQKEVPEKSLPNWLFKEHHKNTKYVTKENIKKEVS